MPDLTRPHLSSTDDASRAVANVRPRRYNETMLKISEKYIVDSKNKKVAVQIPIDSYRKIEEVLENHALGQYILETKDEKHLTVKEAKKRYSRKTSS